MEFKKKQKTVKHSGLLLEINGTREDKKRAIKAICFIPQWGDFFEVTRETFSGGVPETPSEVLDLLDVLKRLSQTGTAKATAVVCLPAFYLLRAISSKCHLSASQMPNTFCGGQI